MKFTLIFISSFLIFNGLFAQSELELALFGLPDVIFEKIETPKGFESAYKIKVKQPLDHSNPEKGYFYQKVYLNHAGFDRPSVIVTEGYNRNANRIYELSRLLNANQIDVEHRYYGESIPDSLDYTYLSLVQQTADLHHINELFRQIYSGKWVSTGISKGGQTTIYYRYFYPEDVDVSIPYVAPLNRELEEPRIYDFLNNVGTDQCRDDILRVQRTVLENRDETLNKMKWFSKGANLKFTYLTFEQAYEYAVLEYPFSFWQWGGHCDKIPNERASVDQILEHFVTISDIGFFSDRDMNAYASHYYQAGTEMGYYGYETEELEDLLKALPAHPHPSAIFMPNKMNYTFDHSLPEKTYNWIQESGDNFIYINGDDDTWSSTAVRPSGKTNALFFFLEGKDHGKARIKYMTDSDRQLFISTLEKWLDMSIADMFQNENKVD